MERQQHAIEHHINVATADMDALDAVVQALVAHDKVNLCARVSKAPAGTLVEPSMSRQQAISRMQDLCVVPLFDAPSAHTDRTKQPEPSSAVSFSCVDLDTCIVVVTRKHYFHGT